MKSDEPTVKPKSPTPSSDDTPKGAPAQKTPDLSDLIPIETGSVSSVRPGAKVDPFTYFSDYYRSNDKDRSDPEKLRKIVRDLNRIGRPRELHAALIGYLKNHPKQAEPWMYEALAGAIELNQGSAADVKKSLDYAADLAQRTHNPNHLVSAADQLYFRSYYDRVGALLDEAMPLIPHRFQPIVMSINLAQKIKDPVRMADSVERLLSLGWPGQDEYFRVESANQVDTLAKSLKEDGKEREAETLLAKLTDSQARDLFVRLSWDGDADFDLLIDEPLGATASYQTPRTVFGGSIIKNGYGGHPEELYVCPRGFDGDYKIRVSTIYTNPSKPVTKLSLEAITHEGAAGEQKKTVELSPDRPNEPLVVHLNGGRRKRVLPYINPDAELMKAVNDNVKKAKKGPKQAEPGPKGKPAAKAQIARPRDPGAGKETPKDKP
jgi:hypothetical protein